MKYKLTLISAKVNEGSSEPACSSMFAKASGLDTVIIFRRSVLGLNGVNLKDCSQERLMTLILSRCAPQAARP